MGEKHKTTHPTSAAGQMKTKSPHAGTPEVTNSCASAHRIIIRRPGYVISRKSRARIKLGAPRNGGEKN